MEEPQEATPQDTELSSAIARLTQIVEGFGEQLARQHQEKRQLLQNIEAKLTDCTETMKGLRTPAAATPAADQAATQKLPEPPPPPPKPEPKAPEKPRLPRRVPYPDEVKRCSDLVYQMRKALDRFLEDPVTPVSRTPICEKAREATASFRTLLLDTFEEIHGAHTKIAQKEYDALRESEPESIETSACWTEESLSAYLDFRTKFTVANVFDPLEALAVSFRDPALLEINDRFAEVMSLKRIGMGREGMPFDPKLHAPKIRTGSGDSAELGDRIVTSVTKSGYIDLISGDVLRQAEVSIKAADNGEKSPAPAARPAAPAARPAAPSAEESLPEDEADLAAVDEATLADEIKRCKSYVFKLKMTVLRLNQSQKLPGSNAAMDAAVKDALAEKSNVYLKGFLDLRSDASELTQAGDPAVNPNAILLRQYREFRTKRFIEDFLDRIESAIRRSKLEDHVPLLNHLAVEMDVGTMAISTGKTKFDPDKHERMDDRSPNDGGGGSKLWDHIVVDVIRSGYMDLAAGKVIRKARVRTKMKAGDQWL